MQSDLTSGRLGDPRHSPSAGGYGAASVAKAVVVCGTERTAHRGCAEPRHEDPTAQHLLALARGRRLATHSCVRNRRRGQGLSGRYKQPVVPKGCRGYMTYQMELLSLGNVDVDHSVYL